MPYLFPRYFAPIFNSCKCYNSILQYWFYEINIRILAANLKKSGCGALLIRRKILMLVSENQHRTIFSGIFCLMFLIDGIKPNVEKKFKPCFIFYETVQWRENKIKPVLCLFVFGLQQKHYSKETRMNNNINNFLCTLLIIFFFF